MHGKIAGAVADKALGIAGLAAEFYHLAFRRDRARSHRQRPQIGQLEVERDRASARPAAWSRWRNPWRYRAAPQRSRRAAGQWYFPGFRPDPVPSRSGRARRCASRRPISRAIGGGGRMPSRIAHMVSSPDMPGGRLRHRPRRLPLHHPMPAACRSENRSIGHQWRSCAAPLNDDHHFNGPMRRRATALAGRP